MEGYDVIGSDDQKIGHVVGTENGYLIVESGMLRKSTHAVPLDMARADEEDKARPADREQGDGQRRADRRRRQLAGRRRLLRTKLGAGGAGRGRHPAGRPAARRVRESLQSPDTDVAPAKGAVGIHQDPGSLRNRREPGLLHRGDERVAIGALVVPLKGHVPHQRRVGELQAFVALQGGSEPHHAALAADAADLDRLRLEGHYGKSTVRSTRSRAGGLEPLMAADLEQAVALAAVEWNRVEQLLGAELARVRADALEQLGRELRRPRRPGRRRDG